MLYNIYKLFTGICLLPTFLNCQPKLLLVPFFCFHQIMLTLVSTQIQTYQYCLWNSLIFHSGTQFKEKIHNIDIPHQSAADTPQSYHPPPFPVIMECRFHWWPAHQSGNEQQPLLIPETMQITWKMFSFQSTRVLCNLNSKINFLKIKAVLSISLI